MPSIERRDPTFSKTPRKTTAHAKKKWKEVVQKFSPAAAQVFGAHTDTTFFTLVPLAPVPGLEVFDPSLRAWVCPEAAEGVGAGDVLVMPGELSEVASRGGLRAAVHRVVGSPHRRVSTPLLVRADRRATMGDEWSHDVWRALQERDGASALAAFRSDRPATRKPSRTYLAPTRTEGEARTFYSMVLGGDAEVLSVDPLVVRLPRFASPDECETLVALGENSWDRSNVVTPGDQKVVDDRVRTSQTTWLDDGAAPCLAALADVAAAVAELPLDHAEKWQLARYGPTEEYKLHTDTIDAFNDLLPGGRFATLLCYLDDDFGGGRTRFPDLGLDVEPKRGDAIFFRNVHTPLLDDEPYAMRTHFDAAHAGEPVTRGTKHILTKWFHPVPYPDGPPRKQDDDPPGPS